MSELTGLDERFEALITRISNSEFFTTDAQRELLRFLVKTRGDGLTAADIEIRHYKHPARAISHNPVHTRERIGDLRKRLENYAQSKSRERWVCFIPEPRGAGGYQVCFEPASWSPTQTFWMDHLEHPDELIVITGYHPFFFDEKTGTILRFHDFNVDAESGQMLDLVKAVHPEIESMGDFKPWQNVFLATGEVMAYETVMRWFHNETGRLVERLRSRESSQSVVQRKSPILLGRPQTNRFIKSILASRQAVHLGYHIHGRGIVRIKNVTDEERLSLRDYPISKDGLVGPLPESGWVFGIVSRLRNPSGSGYVTVIACDYYAMVIARIMEVLTDDKQAGVLLKRMNWPERTPLPSSFEMLFRVALSPGDMEGEGFPELLCWRTHEEPIVHVS